MLVLSMHCNDIKLQQLWQIEEKLQIHLIWFKWLNQDEQEPGSSNVDEKNYISLFLMSLARSIGAAVCMEIKWGP